MTTRASGQDERTTGVRPTKTSSPPATTTSRDLWSNSTMDYEVSWSTWNTTSDLGWLNYSGNGTIDSEHYLQHGDTQLHSGPIKLTAHLKIIAVVAGSVLFLVGVVVVVYIVIRRRSESSVAGAHGEFRFERMNADSM